MEGDQHQSELNGGMPQESGEYQRLHQRGESYARWALFSGIGGAALAISGGAVLIMNRGPGPVPSSTALVGWAGTF